MPYKSGNKKGMLTKDELLELHGHLFKKIGKTWSRSQVVEKLKAFDIDGNQIIEKKVTIKEPEQEIKEPHSVPEIKEPEPVPVEETKTKKKRNTKKKN